MKRALSFDARPQQGSGVASGEDVTRKRRVLLKV